MRVRTRHAGKLRCWTLDANGKRRAEVRVSVDGERVLVPLRAAHETVYYELAPE